MKVRSSMIKEVEWQANTLYVLFNTDEAYAYKKVPKGIYDKMIVAHKTDGSVGGFFSTYVKKAGYEYEKIDWKTRETGESKLEQIFNMEEDFPGQKRDYIRQKAIEKAVTVADRIILDASDGSVEETNYLTSQVALKFVEKTSFATRHELNKKELMENVK